MERIKILAVIARLIFASESDGLTCRVDSVAIPPWNALGAVVDCSGPHRFRVFHITPDGHVLVTVGRST